MTKLVAHQPLLLRIYRQNKPQIMGLLIEHGIIELLGFFILAVWSVYWYLTKNYDYWEKRGVPHRKPQFPFGSTKEMLLTYTYNGKGHDNIYKAFPNQRYYGIIDFRNPSLVLKDPELIKKVMVKDFSYFLDRPTFMGNPKEYIVLHLLNLTGQEWKDMRAKLTPTFTSGKLKKMFSLMDHCSEVLKEKLNKEIDKSNVIDAKDLLARFTMDIIASCAFGLETNNLGENETQFYRTFKGSVTTTKLRYLRRMLFLLFPFILRLFRLNLIRPQMRDFVTNLVRDTIEYRQKNNIKRNDFLDLLINIKQKEWGENDHNEHESTNQTSNKGLTVEQMTAQTFVFFVAGFETSSSLMAFCLYELSRHQNIQDQLYNEIHDVVDKNGGNISYQSLMNMPFLDQVINETLRLYGSAHILTRVCTQSYKIPDSDLVLEKGTKVIIPLYSLHHDSQYYPDPYEFRPERFVPEETKKRHQFVFMPFGEGPRNCIGMRFGLMQTKVGLSTVILNFNVELSPEQEVPIEIDRRSVPLMPANPVLLKFIKRQS